jgi:glc operon protein GlcG
VVTAVTSVPAISAEIADRVVDAARGRAGELGLAVCICVVDGGGNITALIRLDGASFLTATVATNKAITAAGLGVPTGDFAKFASQDPALLAGMSNQPNVAAFPGGVPLVVDGAVAGAIGVAGGRTAEDDVAVAEAGLAAFPTGG